MLLANQVRTEHLRHILVFHLTCALQSIIETPWKNPPISSSTSKQTLEYAGTPNSMQIQYPFGGLHVARQ